MYSILQKLHGNFAIISCILLVILLIKVLIDFLSKNQNLVITKKISVYTLISVHLQLLIGIFLLIINSGILSNIVGKIGITSVSYIEHFSSNILAIILITIFNAKLKKSIKISGGLLTILVIAILMLSRVVPLLIGVIQKTF